jgi:prenyltransferase/squalene oxidase-like repeat protein
MMQRFNDNATSIMDYLARWSGAAEGPRQKLRRAIESLSTDDSGVEGNRLFFRLRNSAAGASAGFQIHRASLLASKSDPAPVSRQTLDLIFKSLSITPPRFIERAPRAAAPISGIGADISANGMRARLFWSLRGDTVAERRQQALSLLESFEGASQIKTDGLQSDEAGDASWPVAIGIEVQEDGLPKAVRVYVCSSAVRLDWLARWHKRWPSEGAERIARTLIDAFPMSGASRYPAGSFALALTWEPGQSLPSLETHLSPRNFALRNKAIAEGARKLLSQLTPGERARSFDFDAVAGGFRNNESALSDALIGAGRESDGQPFVEFHIAANAASKTSEPPFAMLITRANRGPRQAMTAAMSALEERREGERWSDFLLPAGSSDAWVTAYTLYQLTGQAWPYAPPRLRRIARDSLRWLASHRGKKGGWAYSAAAEDDADSTSLALLAFRRFGNREPADAQAFLRSCFRADGGVSTYPAGSDEASQSGYFRSAVEITPLALAALENEIGNEDRKRAVRFLQERQSEDGIWPAYWWVSPLYSTWIALSWLRNGQEIPKESRLLDSLYNYSPVGTFEAALLLLCLCQFGPKARHRRYSIIDRLLEKQNGDGSWEGDAMMRLPHHSTLEPRQQIDAGPSFRDPNGVFTTATAIAALACCID